jgi:hypothetical protein
MKELKFSNLMLIILYIGLLMIFFQLGRNSVTCPPPRATFKYLPRDFNLDSNYPDVVSQQFKDMFEKPTPYIVQLGNDNKRQLL